jgi:hypothetical protein
VTREADELLPLTAIDVALITAAPIFALVRLIGPVDGDELRRAVLRHLPPRLSAVRAEADGEPALLLRPDSLGWRTLELGTDGLAGLLRPNVPLRAFDAIGRRAALPEGAPVTAVAHVRTPGGDALGVSLSHAAGDGLTLVRLLSAVLGDVHVGRAPGGSGTQAAGPDAAVDDREAAEAGPAAQPGSRRDDGASAADPDDDGRRFSTLRLSADARAEVEALAADGRGPSRTVRRLAVVVRRLAPLVLPEDAQLRLRIPIDLRFRGLGIPPDAVGNLWIDALAVVDEPVGQLPPAERLAELLQETIRDRVASLSPDDVDHREGSSLRLRRPDTVERPRPGEDLVVSSLPLPTWPGVRDVHLFGSARLGLVDAPGAGHVDVASVRPLPPGIVEL